MNETEDDGSYACVGLIPAWPCGTDRNRKDMVKKTASALVARWRDYAPTEAALRGDNCLRNGDTDGQHFWLYVVIASENILSLKLILGQKAYRYENVR